MITSTGQAMRDMTAAAQAAAAARVKYPPVREEVKPTGAEEWDEYVKTRRCS